MKNTEKKIRENRSVKRYVRFTQKEMDIIRFLAKQYTGGNVSKWVRHASLSASVDRQNIRSSK